MTIYKYLPKKNFTKFDNKVLCVSSKELTHGSKVLYMFLAHFSNGKRITHAYITKSLDISESALKKYVSELKKMDLILMVRFGAKSYDCFIGSTEIGASKVKEFWRVLDGEDASNPYTSEDIENIQQGGAR